MNDKIFIDSNILIYFYSTDEVSKKLTVEKLLIGNHEIFLSTQVINEFVNVMHRKKKIEMKLLIPVVEELSNLFLIKIINLDTIRFALKISQKYQYSYFDSLIVASALENNCDYLYSEDMHHGQIIEKTLIIHNPFKS